MSRFRNPVLALLILILLSVPAALAGSGPSAAPGGITVGEFALQTARLVQDDPSVRASLSTEQAVALLERAGLPLVAPSGSLLTEGGMSAFFRQAGIQLQTSRPDRPVSPAMAGSVLSTFAGYLSDRTEGMVAPGSISPGQAPGQTPLLESFSDCAALPTVPECRACCLSLPGTNNKLCGRACGRSHAAQKASASEPTP